MQQRDKNVYFFSADKTEGNASMKNLLGGKGANLAEMSSLGISVPPGFTIGTNYCGTFYDNNKKLDEQLKAEILKNLYQVEELLEKKMGDVDRPLLVSVRSGARVSMPGMMDTILNLGLNEQTVEGLAKQTGKPSFAWDSYRRLIQMYSNVVMGMNNSLLEVRLEDLKDDKGYKLDNELTEEDLRGLVKDFKQVIFESIGEPFPEDPLEQLWGAISAVFASWNTPRAITYRELNSIDSSWGTAVNIQAMVFGNLGDQSATGVAFTRDPSTGDKSFFGEYLINAQGEDVVAGIRTPLHLNKSATSKGQSLEEMMPKAYGDLCDVYKKLELHYRDMQDLEFTIEEGRLWMLQTRTGKRTAKAAIKIALDMLDEKLITKEEALLRVEAGSLDQLLHPTLDANSEKTVLTKGLPASPGGVSGEIVFSSERAVKLKAKGKKVILVRIETSPEDIEGMIAAQGILTSRGGMTSHAAVVARGMGKCCVAGCEELNVNYLKKEMSVNGYTLKEGEQITLDGSSGEVILGEVATVEPSLDDDFRRYMTLADSVRRLKVRANADTAKDAQVARDFGAQGIGLCRTEHMFFGPDRLDTVREMILANHIDERLVALSKLMPMQKNDFFELFETMRGLPVTIRLLDPPLHEFLPHTDAEIEELAERINWSKDKLKTKVKSLFEFNPMLGHRGCRLAITYPEIYEMQARAIAEAACDSFEKHSDKDFCPEIMIPLISDVKELTILRKLVDQTVKSVQTSRGLSFNYLVGTMIELPRAALTSDIIANDADFFSYGTNDLTQTTLGLSRDDSGRFLSTYVAAGIYKIDPFASIDVQGVGQLVKTSVDLGRKTRSNLKLGVCGEHGGDPASIEFFDSIGLDYVSCSPFRVPIARLAAAQSTILSNKVENIEN